MEEVSSNVYEKCPIYENENFLLSLVEKSDTEDLLECYSDPVSAKFFNSDNCTSDFVYKTLEEMGDCIDFWLAEYKNRYYVRFSVIDKKTEKAIGTIEFFAKEENFEIGKVGLLRLDLSSSYENERSISDLFVIIEQEFPKAFGIENIITKAIPEAFSRIAALKSAGYTGLSDERINKYDHYYIKHNL